MSKIDLQTEAGGKWPACACCGNPAMANGNGTAARCWGSYICAFCMDDCEKSHEMLAAWMPSATTCDRQAAFDAWLERARRAAA